MHEQEVQPLEVDEGSAAVIVREEAASIVLEARAMVVRDEDTHRAVDDFIRRIKAIRSHADEIFDDSITKAKESLEAARALKKIVTDPLDEAEKLARGKQRSYLTVRENERLEAERKAAAERIAIERAEREARAKGEVAPLFEAPKPVPARVTAEPTRKTWKFDIVDETKVPRMFLMVDEKKLGEYARTMKEKAAVEGVRFYFVVDSVVR